MPRCGVSEPLVQEVVVCLIGSEFCEAINPAHQIAWFLVMVEGREVGGWLSLLPFRSEVGSFRHWAVFVVGDGAFDAGAVWVDVGVAVGVGAGVLPSPSSACSVRCCCC